MRDFARATIALLILVMTPSADARPLTGIWRIDFTNFSFPWDEEMGDSVPSAWHWIIPPPRTRIQVVDGVHHFYSHGQDQYEREHTPRITLHSVTYGDLNVNGTQQAAVHLNYSSGGTANWDFLYIYALRHGRSKLLGLLASGSRADGGLVNVSIAGGYLILDFADAERRVGDCCSEGYIRVHYRWRSGAFVEEGPREKGDLPLRER